MHSRLATCVVLIAGCALLAIPAQPAGQGNRDHHPIVAFASGHTSGALPLVSFRGTAGAATCATFGRPCSPQRVSCCPGLRCVFRGGSTRVGYQCVFSAGSANDSSSSFWEKLSANKLDSGLTEVPSVADSAVE
jgi:hypothetical protein